MHIVIEHSRQTGSRNLTGPKMLPMIWGTYMKLVTKYHISAINSCWEKCAEKYLGTDPSDSYFLFADLVGFYTHWTYMHIFHRIFLSNYWWQESDIWPQASYRYAILWEAFFRPVRFLISVIQNVCSMCIKINKIDKQEVGIWWVQKRYPRYGVPI
jgi:hypothetical protein